MQCDRTREQLGAYRDGELSPDERRAVAHHLEGCRACSDMLADDDRIAKSLRQHGRSLAPPVLAARVRTALHRIDIEAPDAGAGARAIPRSTPWNVAGITKFAASLAAASILSALSTWWLVTASNQHANIERDIAGAHIRSLLQDSPTQIASSDQHTVRPWFAGRADFAPDVKNLTAEGFPLAGGRLDYIADRRVAAAVYKRRLHVINVFMWQAPTTAGSAPQLSTRNGYNLLSWSRDGTAFWAVSDLNAEELRQLQQLL